jgi:hypothetical protein
MHDPTEASLTDTGNPSLAVEDNSLLSPNPSLAVEDNSLLSPESFVEMSGRMGPPNHLSISLQVIGRF